MYKLQSLLHYKVFFVCRLRIEKTDTLKSLRKSSLFFIPLRRLESCGMSKMSSEFNELNIRCKYDPRKTEVDLKKQR